MKILRTLPWPGLILGGILLIYQLATLRDIPFHPDESSWLHMSKDFEVFVTQPGAMAWNPAEEGNPDQTNREIGAPVTKYILGFARWASRLPPPETDWDWTKNWQENQKAGALPDDHTLWLGRLAITLLLPFSLILIYISGEFIGGRTTGLTAALLLGTHTLVLLHDRRAMAEGALTMGVALSIWGIIRAGRHPWLSGLGIALAYNAKQSSLALLLAGLLTVCYLPKESRKGPGQVGSNLVQYLGVFALLTFALNPLLWHNPWQATRASWTARQELLQRQMAAFTQVHPEQVLHTFTQRAAVLLANLYITQPSASEVSNYHADTAITTADYISNPLHNLMRGYLGGGILLTLSLFGFILAGRKSLNPATPNRQALLGLLFATLVQTAALIAMVPLPFQRYAIPLVPFTCLWCAYGVNQVFLIGRLYMSRKGSYAN